MTFTFAPLQESELPLIFGWLSLPHVAEWWRETRDYNTFEEKYRKWIKHHDDIGFFIVYHQDKPIGLIGWHKVATDPTRPETYPERTYGMDIFIADRDYLGKGYGGEIIKQFIKKIIMPMNPTKIIIDPEITNARAIHVYEKVGFKKTKIAQATDGAKMVTAQLMELDPNML